MTIVLNEHEWAKEKLETRTLGQKPFETLSRVARYYLDHDYGKKDTRKAIEQFLLQCEPTASIPKWSDTLELALNRALKYDAIQIDNIHITAPEIARIDALEGKQVRRLAFTLLCLAKYWNIVNPNCDSWVNNKDSDIMSMANIKTSIKRQSLMYYTLNELGLIQFSRRVDNTNVRVCFIEDGDVVMTVSDFRNLGYQYLKYHGEPYFECVNCGLTTKINNPQNKNSAWKQKYCQNCAVEIDIQQRVNSVMRFRHKEQLHQNSN